jgi:hypothetical protein
MVVSSKLGLYKTPTYCRCFSSHSKIAETVKDFKIESVATFREFVINVWR